MKDTSGEVSMSDTGEGSMKDTREGSGRSSGGGSGDSEERWVGALEMALGTLKKAGRGVKLTEEQFVRRKFIKPRLLAGAGE